MCYAALLEQVHKRGHPVDGLPLCVKVNVKLQTFQAVAILEINWITQAFSSDEKVHANQSAGSLIKDPIREALSLLMDIADACITSPWRRLKSCEALFEAVVTGVARVSAYQSSQMLKILLLRFKTLVLAICAQADLLGTGPSPFSEIIVKAVCLLVDAGWNSDRAAVKSFLLTLAAYVRERLEQEKKERPMTAMTQLNIIPLLADMVVLLNKVDVVNIILPLFIESLEVGDASSPGLVRLRVLDAVACMACLRCDKSYREVVVLLTHSYFNNLSIFGSPHSCIIVPEVTTERLETLPGALLRIAQRLETVKLRSDYRQRLLVLCSDVGRAAEAKEGRCGVDFLGPLLPAVAEICSDLDPMQEVELPLLKLFCNLWFYIALFGLAPPIRKAQSTLMLSSMSLASQGTMSGIQALSGPYVWSPEWASAVLRLSQTTPPLVLSSVKWLEVELELDALPNPESSRGTGNEKAAIAHRTILSYALGGQVDVASMYSISGAKATYLLAVTYLEVLRFQHNGGCLNSNQQDGSYRSALICLFEYVETPDLVPAVYQCLTTIVQRAFSAALIQLEEKDLSSEEEVKHKESVLILHALFLINHTIHPDENVCEIADSLLGQLRNKFRQVLWNKQCLEALLGLLSEQPSVMQSNDSGGLLAFQSLTHQRAHEWITYALLFAPCTTQGLLQEYIRQVTTYQNVAHSSKIIALLSDIRLYPSTFTMGSMPAIAAAAAAAGGSDASSLDVLSMGITSANVKSRYAGEIAGMKRLYSVSMSSLMLSEVHGFKTHSGGMGLNGIGSIHSGDDEEGSLQSILISRFMQQLQQFVIDAQQGCSISDVKYRDACLQAAALLLSEMSSGHVVVSKGASQLLRLLCWCPAHIFTAQVMETGVFVWTWLVTAAPQLGPLVLAEVVDAWLWTVASRKGLFAGGIDHSGPVAQLRPQLSPGEPSNLPAQEDPVEGIIVHRLWLGFLLDRFEVMMHTGGDQMLVMVRLIQGSVHNPSSLSSHPAAAGTLFTLLLLGLKVCDCLLQASAHTEHTGVQLLQDSVYRAAFQWFTVEPGWYETDTEGFAQAEALAVAIFTQHFALDQPMISSQDEASIPLYTVSGGLSGPQLTSTASMQTQIEHPIWAKRKKQLLLMLCQHEADRLDTWANPLKVQTVPHLQQESEQWGPHVKTAWSVDPQIALALVARFPSATTLKAEVASMVQAHVPELMNLPEALPYFVTPKAVEEDSVVLHWLLHWKPCSITCALNFLTPSYKGHPRVIAYVLRVMESYPPERVTFFMPQLVQALRYDQGGMLEGYLMAAAQQSNLFAHILIWQLQGEEPPPAKEAGKEEHVIEGNVLYDLVPRVKQRIIDSFTPEANDVFLREFHFIDKVTSISGVLYPLPKEERRAGIRRELEKIELEGDDLYLPTAPNKLVRGIELDSGIPLQSAAKVPIMITFQVVDKDGNPDDVQLQACIFKVGDDCRQDVLALQVIALLKNIWEAVGLDLYVFPYGVLPTGYGRGIIEVVPNARSRNQMGEMTDGGLYEIFQQDYGAVGSPSFEQARNNFLVSSAGYAVASLLLQPKDRHNGNLLFDNEGRLVHIDFGFILETSPGGNMRFESAQFKLSHEMTQLLDPSGIMKSDIWNCFVSLCVKGYLAARVHMEGIINTVALMVESGLPCFSRGDPIGNLRKRFHPEMSERSAANYMIKTCEDAYNKWSTAGYDLIQYLQQGIER
ncbi:hypothetical protein BDL97_02G062700 [Sphagnum fallax]|nr:hypothetical protein BDL97_02G062700 [Sphagnum fallax]